MNTLGDTRELVTTTSAPDVVHQARTPRASFIAGFVDDLLYQYPDVELTTIRIQDLDGIITVIGRRGPLLAAPVDLVGALDDAVTRAARYNRHHR